ncbi:cytochrome B [Acuticoccus sediminis]|uniref:Cytochrome B n=1 Tax=Acuticoccus sediminis TaxID=2184697 RepID=A0A8B2NXU5_9HYPH|nr:cytochrome b/b6 domain-containing protein [Acuticoccus sediminis]RAI02364.1 cytochrome B [Acuticoccus sediminis]
MAQSHPIEGYTPLQKILHWAVVLLLIAQYLVLEDGMGPALRDTIQTGTPVLTTMPLLHMGVGILILILALVRIALRAMVGAPPPPAHEPPIFKTAAGAVHVLFYVLLIGLPLGGLAAYFIPSGLFGEVHEVATNVLLALAGLHVVAVVVHQFWWKSRLMQRMT